jgi:protein-S-isoprenylcysteine O-methyltransferase Ste14
MSPDGSDREVTAPPALFWRAVVAFLALPGTVAFLIPWMLRPRVPPVAAGVPVLVPGAGVLTLGVILLLWCVYEFYVSGHGTLAPWAPPKHLVTSGPYRISRNPMYVAVLLILCGWALTFPGRRLWVYTGLVALAFHLRVVFQEEPWLTRTHGAEWLAYRARVLRWIGVRPGRAVRDSAG